MAGYGKKRYGKPMKKRTSGTSSKAGRATGRRRLQTVGKTGAYLASVASAAASQAAAQYLTSKVDSYFRGKGKSKGRKRSKTMGRVKFDGDGGYNQWTQRYQQATFGRLTARKIDRMSTDKIILLHQRIGAFNDNGQVYVSNYNNGTDTVLPLILMELNSCTNFINGTLNNVAPVYQMSVNNTTAVVGWNVLAGQDKTGSPHNNWQLERGPHTAATSLSYPMDNAIHKWSSIDLECWGQVNKPTKYSIMLCQFNEDVVPPDVQSTTNWTYGNFTGNNAASEFWQSLVKHYSYSPLAKLDDGFNRKKMKILKSYTFNIDPTANYESDPDPHVKTMKLFFRFNRMCNFQWKFTNTNPQLPTTELNAPNWQQEDGENQVRVHPNARLFVMIRASDFTRKTAPEAVTNATTPSISWRMRSAYMISQ